jgi:hypothetical protein
MPLSDTHSSTLPTDPQTWPHDYGRITILDGPPFSCLSPLYTYPPTHCVTVLDGYLCCVSSTNEKCSCCGSRLSVDWRLRLHQRQRQRQRPHLCLYLCLCLYTPAWPLPLPAHTPSWLLGCLIQLLAHLHLPLPLPLPLTLSLIEMAPG